MSDTRSMMAGRATSRWLVCVVVGAAACVAWTSTPDAQSASTEVPFGELASFHVSKSTMRAHGASPSLVDKAGSSSFRYFRMLGQQFAARTCYEFRDLRWRLPSVAVHGDAHLEQFVVTNDTFGLSDFDRAGFGPAVVDLVRYGASLHLACRDVQWPCDPAQAVANYFDTYRAALDHPVARRQPAVVDRVRSGDHRDRIGWLKWADNLMEPMPPADEQAFRAGWRRFVDLMKETTPQRPESFYRISRFGALHMGIGSAIESKTLIRIEGPTDALEDDLILEARTTAVPDGRECVWRPANGGSLHVLMLTSLLAQRLPDVFGFLPREGAREAPELWIQSWDPGYQEVLLSELRSQTDLDELATDAATQLAGHFWTTFPEPLRLHQRFAQLRAFEMTADRARGLARKFAEEAATEWARFRREP